MRKVELSEVKKIELNLLIQFDTFCKKHNLYYVLCGGTLLGAVRHKGFIPWDDDIDVLMPRPDYEKLMLLKKEMITEIPSYIKMTSWKNKSSNYPFVKWVDSRTKIYEKYYNSDIESNIWIDIFPIDGNPDSKSKLNHLYFKSKFLRKILMLKYARLGEGKSQAKKYAKFLIKPFLKSVNTYRLCDFLDKIAKTYKFESCNYIGGVLWGYGPQERVLKDSFLKPIKMEFEGYTFNAPSNYDDYLKGLYKDYMQIPPEDKRITHSFEAYIEE